jgi:outer membrane protein
MPTRGRRYGRGGTARVGILASAVLAGLLLFTAPSWTQARRTIPLTLETAVDLAMDDSYRIRRLRLEVDRTRSLLQAQRAGLKSRVYMNFAAPDFERVSEHKWNSTLQRNEIVMEHSQLWQMDFSIEQPVILMGYPTNGYLSLNNRVYRYTQFGNGDDDVRYYNRYFMRYRQPMFQPNRLKNNLEEAELDLERSELAFQNDALDIVDDIADDYYRLVELAYEEVVYSDLVANLERASAAAQERASADSTRAIEASQAQVALANAREQLQQSRSNFRLAVSRVKQLLRLNDADSVVVTPELEVIPLQVDLDRAIEFGLTLRPQLRSLDIQRRKDEIDLSNTRGDNSFRMNVEFTYGREMEDPVLRHLTNDPSNSYTVGVSGHIPIWDWGAKRARVEAERLSLERTHLSIEETRDRIQTEIRNVVRNLDEYQQRAMNMEENLELAKSVSTASLAQYREGKATMLDLLQAFERQESTADNFLDAYLGYRKAVLDLQEMTYFDFENQLPVLERFEIRTSSKSLLDANRAAHAGARGLTDTGASR